MSSKVIKFNTLIIHNAITKIVLFRLINNSFPHIPKYNYNKFLYI